MKKKERVHPLLLKRMGALHILPLPVFIVLDCPSLRNKCGGRPYTRFIFAIQYQLLYQNQTCALLCNYNTIVSQILWTAIYNCQLRACVCVSTLDLKLYLVTDRLLGLVYIYMNIMLWFVILIPVV